MASSSLDLIHEDMPDRESRPITFFRLSRPELYFVLVATACANAAFSTVVETLSGESFVEAASKTFGINIIVWIGFYFGLGYLVECGAKSVRRSDAAFATAVLLACLLPLGPLTWPVVSALAIYIMLSADAAGDDQTRAGWTILAITVPTFWSKKIFAFLSDFFLAIDAMLVSAITQTERIANTVRMPDGIGLLQIGGPCASLANVSLAICCWILFTQYFNVRWSPRNFWWCGLACLSVVAINVTRIALIGFYPQHYELLHGGFGSTVVGWLSTLVVLVICYRGASHGVVRSP